MNSFSWETNLGTTEDLIAVVGMACRLPGGNTTPDAYWSFLLKRGCGIGVIPEDRWRAEAFYDENSDALAKSVSKWGGFLDDIRSFDAGAFGISPREADSMDPQQRLLLQAASEAIEDSGAPLEAYQAAKTGVYVGVSQSDYRTLQELRPTNPESFAGTGYALCINANRISHRLNLSGPSFAVDTACSSSLVALNEAVQSLASGGCDRAIVAGVNIIAHPSSFIAFSRAGMLSNTGQVSTFDVQANGFVRGEGVGVVVLKPYAEALRDGDRIHGVIHATNCNQDGRTSTITAPSQAAQIDMLDGLLNKSGLRPDQVGYVEAHGTGTPVGDPIEAGAIGRVIGQQALHGPVFVGSGKANVGHGEPVAGITGFIKAILSVRNKQIAPNINFENPNPNIPFDALNLKVPTKPEEFPERDGLRVAVVNSFGFGGTNASALVSSAPPDPAIPRIVPAASTPARAGLNTENWPHLFPLSAGTSEGLALEAAALRDALKDRRRLKDAPLSAIAANLAQTRSHKTQRAVILARSRKELLTALTALAENDAEAIDAKLNIHRGQVSDGGKLCFMFAGQGSQWWGMARQFMEDEPIFAKAVEDYDAHFVKAAGWSIRDELLRDEASSRIDDTTVTQPALFAIQSGLAALWAHVGVRPDMVVGHSIGEAAASYVAGGISLDGAARFLSKRGAIRDQLGAKGAMAAIGLAREDVEALLPDHGLIGIAAVNGPGSVTISGDYDAIHDFVEEFAFTQPDTFIRILKVDTAWHSYQLDAGEAWFRKKVRQIDWSVPKIPFISTVTGKPETQFDIEYGWQNLRQPVMFQAGIEAALKLGATTFVELGPHATLAGPTKSTALESGARIEVMNSISRKDADFDVFARTLADLFVAGQTLDWPAITGNADRSIKLPPPAWSNEAHWTDSEEVREYLKSARPHPFLGMRQNLSSHSWRAEINTKSFPYLKDHRLQADKIFPGAGYMDMIVRLGRDLHGVKPIEIENAQILDALFLPDDADILLNSSYDPTRQRAFVHSRQRDTDDEWIARSQAFLRATDVPAPKAPSFDPTTKSMTEIPVDCAYDVDTSLPFVNYGPAFQVIDKLWMGRGRVVARMTAPDAIIGHFDQYEAHPALLDGCLQLCDPRMTPARIRKGREPGDPIYLPIGARQMRFYKRFPKEIMVYARHRFDAATQTGEAEFIVTDLDGEVLAAAEGLAMKALPTKAADAAADGPKPQFARQVLSAVRDPFVPSESQGKPWVVIGRPGSDEAALMAAFAARGVDARLIDRATLTGRMSDALDQALGDDMAKGAIGGLIYAPALDLPVVEETTAPDALFHPINDTVCDLIALGDFVEFHRASEAGLARVIVLSAGAFPDAGDWAPARALTQSPVLAVTRVLSSELPEFDIRHADIAPDATDGMEALADYALSDTDETEVVFTSGGTLAPRLQKIEGDALDPRILTVDNNRDDTNFHATMRQPGAIDDIDLWELPQTPLGPDQVRVRVAAVGLNFRDIMAVTGLLPSEAEPDPAWQNLGLEFGGVVDAVGENVTGFKPGDRVMGMQRRCLQRFMVLDPIALTKVPDHISLEQAATIPSAFATAHYALNHVGRMQSGDRVFIHVATGGVGTAAVQLAKAEGAEIFATAGNPKKRKILKDLGVPHVMDSRSLKFADDVTRITKGAGVDVLLNSLPGDYITKGLDIMAPYGRFLEIGKRDVYADSAVGMKALRKNVTLAVLDLAAMGQERPELLARLMAELADRFANRDLDPLPLTAFPISQIGDAFRFMSQARHVGKVVVTLDEPSFRIRRDVNRPVSLDQGASYLVTGGTGGFGLTIADWLSRAGASKLYLASRSGTFSTDDQPRLDAITARGTQVEAISLDITDTKATQAFVTKTAKGDRPLRGAIHAAAVIKDGFITQLTPDMISDVLRPKVLGGWALHQALSQAGIQPDFLIGFSSIAQVIGSGGQANYVAANAFLEALAAYRRARGQSGTAINWGAMAESGFVARNEGLANYLEFVGLAGLTDADTDLGMEIALSRDIGQFVYANVDWAQLAQANRALGRSARFAPMLQKDSGGDTEVRARLMTLSGDALLEAAKDFIVDEVSSVLKVDASAIQTNRQMSELGLDSLSSFELKMRVESALDVMLPVSKFLQAPSIDELAVLLSDEVSKMVAAEAAAASATDQTVATSRSGSAARQIHLASNAQIGAIATALAPMSSEAAKAGLEHRVSLTLPKGKERPDAEKALRKLLRRHPMLRVQITSDGDTDGLEFNAEYGLQSDDSVQPLDVAQGELFRASLTGSRLILQVHEAVADATSAQLLADELKALIAGADLPRAATAKAVKALPARLRYDPESAQGQTDRSFFYYTLADGAASVPFATRKRPLLPASLGRDHGPAGIVTGTCPKASEAEGMTALALALRAATHSEGKVLMARVARATSVLPKTRCLGPFSLTQPVLVSPAAQNPLARTKLERTLSAIADHPSFDSYSAADVFADWFDTWGVTPFQIGFHSCTGVEIKLPVTGTRHDLFLQMAGAKYRIIYDTDIVTDEEITAITRGFENALENSLKAALSDA